MSERLEHQLAFLLELDRAKSVYRRTYVTAEDRPENDAEHMWHLAMFVVVLAEHADEPIDVLRALELVLVHDIVEIDAGDAFLYDTDGRADQEAKERAAADRIFGLLPSDQAERLRSRWEEFEARETPEARFAAAVDRLAPLLLNHAGQGRPWQEHSVTADRVREVNRRIERASGSLWGAAQSLIDDSVAKGYLAEPDPSP